MVVVYFFLNVHKERKLGDQVGFFFLACSVRLIEGDVNTVLNCVFYERG